MTAETFRNRNELRAWQKATNAPTGAEKNPKFDAAALQAAIDAAQKGKKENSPRK